MRTAAQIGASRGRIVSTPTGYVLSDRETIEDRARTLADFVAAAGEPVSMRRLRDHFEIPETTANNAVKVAVRHGWIEDRRHRNGRGGFVAAGERQTAA